MKRSRFTGGAHVSRPALGRRAGVGRARRRRGAARSSRSTRDGSRGRRSSGSSTTWRPQAARLPRPASSEATTAIVTSRSGHRAPPVRPAAGALADGAPRSGYRSSSWVSARTIAARDPVRGVVRRSLERGLGRSESRLHALHVEGSLGEEPVRRRDDEARRDVALHRHREESCSSARGRADAPCPGRRSSSGQAPCPSAAACTRHACSSMANASAIHIPGASVHFTSAVSML